MPTPILILLIMLITAAGCAPEPTEQVPTATALDWLPLKIGNVEIKAQVVITRGEQGKGLMHRTELPVDSGMLFPYRSPQPMAFWMSNTSIPLDIGFFDGTGKLLEIHRLVPFDTNRTVSKAHNLQYALEMDAGWFSRNEIYPGKRLNMALLADALRARGANPLTYGIPE